MLAEVSVRAETIWWVERLGGYDDIVEILRRGHEGETSEAD